MIEVVSISGEQLLRAGLIGRGALNPKRDRRSEARRLETLELARAAYARRVRDAGAKIERMAPGDAQRVLCRAEAVMGRERAEEFFANASSVEVSLIFLAAAEDRERMILALKGTIQGLLFTEKNASRRRALRVKLATPAWVDFAEIAKLVAERYKREAETGLPHHIDHIVPLAGRNVCGLHVHHNMRVIPAAENVRKGNRFG